MVPSVVPFFNKVRKIANKRIVFDRRNTASKKVAVFAVE